MSPDRRPRQTSTYRLPVVGILFGELGVCFKCLHTSKHVCAGQCYFGCYISLLRGIVACIESSGELERWGWGGVGLGGLGLRGFCVRGGGEGAAVRKLWGCCVGNSCDCIEGGIYTV